MRRVVAVGLALVGAVAVVLAVVLALALWSWEQMHPGFIG